MTRLLVVVDGSMSGSDGGGWLGKGGGGCCRPINRGDVVVDVGGCGAGVLGTLNRFDSSKRNTKNLKKFVFIKTQI